MTIQNPLRLILLWFILILCMMLHFNYHIGVIFYGFDVVRDGADGTIPSSTHVIRSAFYVLPLLWIVLLMINNSKALRLGLFLVSILYCISHAMHLAGDAIPFDGSQTPLLTLTFIISGFLTYEHYLYWRLRF